MREERTWGQQTNETVLTESGCKREVSSYFQRENLQHVFILMGMAQDFGKKMIGNRREENVLR